MQSFERQPSRRLHGLDFARGVALIGMVVFHFNYDLEMFGRHAPGTMESLPWTGFARLVAGSFVFLAGVSLVLAHGRGIRWRAFARDTATVAAAALAVSAATFVAMPGMFVFFGILHSIALSRVLGLAALRLQVWALVALAAVVWALPFVWSSALFDPRALAWIGFSAKVPLSVDFEPLFPWFAPFLLGMAAARLGLVAGWRQAPGGSTGRALAWAGRHSLAIYLVHQPIIFGSMWLLYRGFGG